MIRALVLNGPHKNLRPLIDDNAKYWRLINNDENKCVQTDTTYDVLRIVPEGRVLVLIGTSVEEVNKLLSQYQNGE